MEKIGARIGAFYSVVSVATLVGTPIGGVLLGSNPKSKEQYHGLIAFSVSPHETDYPAHYLSHAGSCNGHRVFGVPRGEVHARSQLAD